MNPLLVIVMVHAQAQATFDRHLPIWESHGAPLLVVCPVDSIVRTKWPVLAMERATHHSTDANRRMRRMFEFCATLKYEKFIFFEYDAICLKQDLSYYGGSALWGNWFGSDQPQFKGHQFIHPPLIFTQDTLVDLIPALVKIGDDAEAGYWDRALGYACEVGNIDVIHYQEEGFARNTIERDDIAAAVEARKKCGAVFFHGIKSPEAFFAITT